MGRSSRATSKTDSLTLNQLDGHFHDGGSLHSALSPSSTSLPRPGPTELPISDSSAQSPSQRPRGRGKSELGCSLRNSERGEDSEIDVVERLEEVVELGSADDPDLSHDYSVFNSQSQNDELLVIESIYGDNVLKLEPQNGLRTFQVHIEIEAGSGISVTAELDSSVNQTTDYLSNSIKVQYLPPIVLTCALPKSYPSHRPPYFTLSAQWLDPMSISKLCSMLDSIWNEQSGQEVIYQWVAWLSCSSLSYLGFQTEIVLGPYGTRCADDKRAVSGMVSPNSNISLITRYNDERLHENFQQNLHDCCICFNEYPGTQFARLPCGHFFCWKCMKTFADVHVSEGTTNKLDCPEAKCGRMIPQSLLKQLLSQEEYERWESLTLQKTLESMSDMCYCPRCNTPCIEDDDHHTQCFKCFYSFCTICKNRRHVGNACMTPNDKLKFLLERQNSARLTDEQRRKELDEINEIKSVRAILHDAKQCPTCGMAISRIEGCDVMTCKNCRQSFCYRCNKALTGHQGHVRSRQGDEENNQQHRNHDDSLSSVSQPTTSQPCPCTTEIPNSDSSSKMSSERQQGCQPAMNSKLGCSNGEVVSLETEAGSLRICKRVKEVESKVSKDGNREFGVMERSEKLVGSGSVEEPELSDENLSNNLKAQEDELLAMESLYGDKVLKLGRQNGLQSFQVHIAIEARNEISVTLKLDTSGDQNATHNRKNTDNLSYSFKVQYLPPIVLTCELPKSYPSHRPPCFTISTKWLDPVNTAKLCSMLDSIWNKQRGQEVICRWVEWLSSSSLPYLGFDSKMMLGPYGTKHAEDKRAVSGMVSPDIDIPLMRDYNDERLQENFLQNLHECCICFNEYPGTGFVRLPCDHFFCRKCMTTFMGYHIREGDTNKLRCPETMCGDMIPPSLLKQLLSQEDYGCWESLALQKTLASMPDKCCCPRCNMPCIKVEDHYAQCSKCVYSFCTICSKRRHDGNDCMPREVLLKILLERQNQAALSKEERKRIELDKINEIMSIHAIRRDAMQCPSCKIAISRIAGCNHMTCRNCGQHFCYLCGKEVHGPSHFSGVRGCKVFPEEMIRQWEERMNNQRRAVAPVRVIVRGLNCPFCLRFNAKSGSNNHLICGSCKTQYCYSCKQILWQSDLHFRSKGCRQHTWE